MGVKSSLVGLVPFAAMMMVETQDVGLTTLSKAVMSIGMSHYVFVVNSNVVGSLILLPFFFILNKTKRPPLSVPFLCKVFLLSLLGITVVQNCVITDVNYSSPTIGSAMGNLMPALTFLLAVIFRIEKLELRSSRSQIKILGTVVSISGSLIVSLYKGPAIGAETILPQPNPSSLTILETKNNWVIGVVFLATAGLSLATFYVFQAALLKGYPSEMTLVSLCCFFGTIQTAVVSMITERNPIAWKLKSDIELISVIHAGVYGSVVTYGVLAWCIRRKGPLFVALFKPVGTCIAAFMDVILLGDTLHVGSVIGAIITIAGFYGVIWAQTREEKGGVYKTETTAIVREPSLREARKCLNYCGSFCGLYLLWQSMVLLLTS